MTRTTGKFCIPARYVFLVVRVIDMFASSFIEGLMPLAITSMVRTTTTATTNSSSTVANMSSVSLDVCPGAPEVTNSSSSSNKGDVFEWSELLQSYVTNGNTYGALFSMMLAARLVQAWSPKWIAAAASLITVVTTALAPLLSHWSVYALIVARVTQGFATGANMPTMFALDSTWFPPDERQQMIGIIFGSMNVASILSSSLTGYLIDSCGWESVFYIFAGFKFASSCLWIFTIYDTPQKHPGISEEEKNYITSTVKKETEVNLPVPWLRILLSAPVWAYLSISISNMWIQFILNIELPTYLTKMLYYSTTNAGYIVSASNAVGFLVQFSCGFVSQWLQKKGYISHLTSYRIFNAIVTLGTAAAIIGITQSGCNVTTIITLILLIKGAQSLIIAGSFLNHLDLAINFVPTLSGINGTVSSLVGVISPTLVAAIINNNQTLTAWSEVFYISAVVSAAPYIIFFIYGSVEEQPWNKIQNEDEEQQDKEEPHSNTRERNSSVCVSIK